MITQPGTVISGLDIQGTVQIAADNVTLQNCKITAAAWSLVTVDDGVKGAVVQNCEINGVGSGNDGSCGISGHGTFISNNIYNVENGFSLAGNSTVIENNYIHDLNASGSPHYDGIQIDGNVSGVTISHNTIINDHNQTSAVMIDNYFGPISNIQVDNNLLAGGGYTVYSDGQFSGGSIAGVSFTNNHMEAGGFGITAFDQNNSPTYTGNVNDGATLVATLNTSANIGSTTTGSAGTPTDSPVSAPSAPVIASSSPDTGVSGDGVTDDQNNNPTYTGDVNDGATLVATPAGTPTDSPVPAPSAPVIASSSPDTGVSGDGVTDANNITLDGTAAAGSTVSPNDTSTVEVTNVCQHWDHTATIKGTADPNSEIKLSDGTISAGSVTAGADGKWSFDTSDLSGETHAFTAEEVDTSGHVVGTSSGEAIIGSAHSDTLTGTTGNDVMVGKAGADTFVFASSFGHDVIKDFAAAGPAHDTVQFSKNVFDSFASVLSHAAQSGVDVVIATGSDTLTLKNTKLDALNSHDFHFA